MDLSFEIFSLAGRYVRSGDLCRDTRGAWGLGSEIEAPVGALLGITASSCRLPAAGRAARTGPGCRTSDSRDAGEPGRQLGDR